MLSSGSRRAVLVTGGVSAVLAEQGGITGQVQRPSLLLADAVGDRLPAGAVPVEVPVLQLDASAVRAIGDEAHLDLTGPVRVGLDLPPGADIPAEHHPVRRLVG